MSDTMKVFKQKAEGGRNFRIEGITEEDILWKDFERRGNPSKNVPAGGYATFCVKFDSPNAGNTVVQQLEDLYDVNTNIVVPDADQDFKPFKTMKLASRFDMFPPTIILHSGQTENVLSHYIQKANTTDRIPQHIVDEFNENVRGLQNIFIDHIDVDVNVSPGGKPYVNRMDVYQAVDEFGNLRFREEGPGRKYEEMAEMEHPEE